MRDGDFEQLKNKGLNIPPGHTEDDEEKKRRRLILKTSEKVFSTDFKKSWNKGSEPINDDMESKSD